MLLILLYGRESLWKVCFYRRAHTFASDHMTRYILATNPCNFQLHLGNLIIMIMKNLHHLIYQKCAFKAIRNSNDNMLQHKVDKKGKKHKNWIASVGELNCSLFHFSSKNWTALYSISVLKTELLFIPFQFYKLNCSLFHFSSTNWTALYSISVLKTELLFIPFQF